MPFHIQCLQEVSGPSMVKIVLIDRTLVRSVSNPFNVASSVSPVSWIISRIDHFKWLLYIVVLRRTFSKA